MRRANFQFLLLLLACCLALLSCSSGRGFAQQPMTLELAKLVNDLKSTDKGVVYQAELAFQQMGKKAAPAIPTLISLLKDNNPDVCANAAYALGDIGKEAAPAVPFLIAAIKSDNRRVCVSAIKSLGDIGKDAAPAIPILTANLKYKGSEVYYYATRSLGDISTDLENQVTKLSYAELNTLIPQLDTAEKVLFASRPDATDDANAKDIELGSVHRALDRLKAEERSRFWEGRLFWVSHNKGLTAIGVYLVLVLSGNALLLTLWPRSLLAINDSLKRVAEVGLPAPLNGIKLAPGFVLGVGFVNYHPRVLDTWVKKYAPNARKHLDERPTFRDRRVYISIPIGFPDGDKPPQPADFHDRFARKSGIVLLWGEGGSGKTTLACHMARWALADQEHARLCKSHRMLPVFIEENVPGAKPGDSAILLEAIGKSLKQLTGEEVAPSNDLVKKLLERRRVLLIVDGYSELNPETQAIIDPNATALPINALLVTSRDSKSLQNATPLLLQTGLLKGQAIATFVEDYLTASGMAEPLKNGEFYNELKHFNDLVGDREITALLAGLYARYILESRENTIVERPQNVPELMDAYVSEMCRKAGEQAYPIQTYAPLAYKIAWNCLKATLTPITTSLADVCAALLQTDDKVPLPTDQTDANVVITQFVDKLHLLQRHGSIKDTLKFTLDPIGEYLAARYLVRYGYGSDTVAWYALFDEAEAKPGAPQAIAGFVRALDDTLATKSSEGNVPAEVQDELRRRFASVLAPPPPQADVSPPAPPYAPGVAVVSTAAPTPV